MSPEDKPTLDNATVEVTSTNVDDNLRLLFFELKVRDPYNGWTYDLALVSTRRGITMTNVRKQKDKAPEEAE